MPVCDLGCGAGFAHEFIGPVRIIVVDDDEYYSKLFKMGLLMFVYVLMGILLAVPALYFLDFTVHFTNIIHVLIGTFTCQCLIPIGVLLHNPLALSTAPMRPAERLAEHVKLQALSCLLMCCTFTATFFIKRTLGDNGLHKFIGYIAVYICIINALLGALLRFWDWDCCGLKWKPCYASCHKQLGILTVFFCAITYTSGICTWRFEDHLPRRVQDNLTNFLTLIAFMHTAIIIYYPISKYFEEKDPKRPTRL